MTKAKTNALEALRALIAERQQYEQWIATLESKREGTPVHVFERVLGDYNSRLQRVVGDIKGHAEELQLSISALSSRLVEVAREQDNRRDALQEAELRATVGEYEPQQWEQLKAEAERALEKIAADRAGLDAQLAELRSIQKLSEVGSIGSVADVAAAVSATAESTVSSQPAAPTPLASPTPPASPASTDGPSAPYVSQGSQPASYTQRAPSSGGTESAPLSSTAVTTSQPDARDQGHLPLEQAAAASAAVLSSSPASSAPSGGSAQTPAPSSEGSSIPPRARTGKTPPFGGAPVKAKPPEPRTDQAKTLKCPECGTANYPTEWYCERCGGELATM